MAAAAAPSSAKPTLILPPLPNTKRGYGIVLTGHAGKDLFCYGYQTHVVLRSLSDPSKAELFSEHKAKVNVARVSPNGEWVASGDESGRVLVWGTKTKVVKNDVVACRNVVDLDWSGDSERIVAVGEGTESLAKVFPYNSGNSIGDMIGHSKKILTCAFKPQRPFLIMTGGEDNANGVYEGPPFKLKTMLREHERFVNCVRYTPDGKFAVSVGADRKILVLDGATGAKVMALEAKEGHSAAIYAAAVSSDGKRVLTASADKTAKIWNLESGAVETTFNFGNGVEDQQVGALWIGDHLLTVSLSGCINYLDPASPAQPKRVLHGCNTGISSLALNPGAALAFVSEIEGRVTRWDLKSCASAWSDSRNGVAIHASALSADQKLLYVVGADDSLRALDCASMRFTDARTPMGGAPKCVTASKKDAGLVVVGVAQGKVQVVRNGNVVHTLAVSYAPLAVALSPDDSELAVAGDDRKIHVLNLAANGTLSEKPAPDVQCLSDFVTYSPDGHFLSVAERGRKIYILDRQKAFATVNEFLWEFHNAAVRSIAWKPSGTAVATCSLDQRIILWTDTVAFASEKKQVLELAHAGGVSASAFLDDSTLVTCGNDVCLKTWAL
jgi:WD40 repeat protein